jgi:hypothetical protein
MNEIEQKFYDAYQRLRNFAEPGSEPDPVYACYGIKPQYPIDIYIVDFLVGRCAVEIDGHEYHKTKEQRCHDAKRDRYLIREGYIPVRFTASEVFVDAEKCVFEAFEIAHLFESEKVGTWFSGWNDAKAKLGG